MKSNAWFAALIVASFAFSAQTLLNATAGRVGKKILTAEDVRFVEGLGRLKEGQTPKALEPEALKAATQRLVFEEMVYAEMRSLQLEPSGLSAAAAQLKNLKAKTGDAGWKAYLRRFNRDESAASAALQRGTEVEAFLQKKIETLTPVVTEAEALRYFKQNATKYAGVNFESVKTVIQKLVQKQEMEKGLSEWVRLLRDKHKAMNLMDR